MFRSFILFSLFTFLYSCGLDNAPDYTFQADPSSGKIGIFHLRTPGKLSFEITIRSNLGNIQNAAEFCMTALKKFKKYSRAYDPASGTVRIGPADSWYQIYFQLAVFSLPEIKNDLIRYGIIQSTWRKWVRESEGKNDLVSVLVRDYQYDLFLQEDLREYFRYTDCEWSDLENIYPYEVSYLLREILFISLQEMLSRPARYYNPREYGSIFCQMVTLPEAAAFTEYLTAKYGLDRTLKLGKTSFSTNSWKNLTGEYFHDNEGDFTSGLEKNKFQGKLQDPAFREKLDSYLKLYNQMTKSTLFKK